MTSKLIELMTEPLPSISSQKKLAYRTNQREVRKLYNIINEEIFDNKLPPAKIEVKSHCRGYWGICMAQSFNHKRKSSECVIRLSDKWYCKQWLINTLAHEMVHQYQWDVYSKQRHTKEPVMSHGTSFFMYKRKLAKFGITLKRSSGANRWFKHQRLDKC